jgi:hypothetical protein
MYRRIGSRLSRAIVMVTLALTLSSPQPHALAQFPPVGTQAPGCWTTYKPLASEPGSHLLKAVAGSSARDVWAVGIENVNSRIGAIAAHWDGNQWTRVPVPQTAKISRLYGVTVLSPTDAWAVGTAGEYETESRWTYILHWDGRAWQRIPSPNGNHDVNDLLAVAAVAPDDVWAGGYGNTERCSSCREALLLHWDGREWTRVNSPALPVSTDGLGDSTIEGFAVISKDDIWVVGGTADDDFRPLAIHWNGVEWKRATLPHVRGLLHGVAAVAPGNVWAVGNASQGERGTDALTIHWDGSAWNIVPNPGVSANAMFSGTTYWLTSVAARSANEVWAAGSSWYPRGAHQMYIMRWDGREWRRVVSPVQELGSTGAILEGAAVVDGDVWLSGDQDRGMVLRHTGIPCAPPAPVPGEGSRSFPETGKTVSGVFLKYWEERGGLMQQGYPISDPMGEVSDLDGKLYTVQYFERAVFEYHPENIPEFQVLLAQLGTLRYREEYPDGAPNQRPSADPDAVLFPETGKRLGGAFLRYWQTHGGLMQQGFPISDEFTEVSDLDGKRYTVPYFERAVFEQHPENAGTPYEVLLSHLGSTLWRDKYGTQEIDTPLAR